MSSNVGLSTPRGSGTSGYVQRNLSALNPSKKPSSRFAPYPSTRPEIDNQRHKQRQPDAKILAHDRARDIEVRILEFRDKLEDEGVTDEEELERQCEEMRAQLKRDAESGRDAAGHGREGKKLKGYQVHEMAKAKIEESEKLRVALGIRKDYEEGAHWKRAAAGSAATEERLKNGLSEVEPEREKGKARGRARSDSIESGSEGDRK